MGMITELLIELLESNRKSKNITESRRAYSRRTVKREFTPLWLERKWRKFGGLYFGYFRTPYGSYQGEIIEHHQGYGRYYIIGPPQCLTRHSHSVCFFPRGDNKYEIHFSTRARNVDEGIMAIEKILTEAHELPIT